MPPLQLNISRDGPELKAQCVQIEIFGAVSCLKAAERPVGGRSQRVAARVALIVRPVQSVTFDAVQRRDQVTEFKFVDERQSVRQTLDAVSRLQRPPRHDPRSNLARNFQISTAIVFSNLAPNVTPFCRPSTINLTVQHSLRRSSRHARHPSACGALARYRSSLQTLLADPPALHNISIKQNKNGPSATTFTEKPFHFFIENWPIYPLKRIKVNSIKFLFFFHFHVHFSFICFLTLCQGQVERYGREQRTLRPAAVDWRRHRSWRLRELCQGRGKGQQ